MRNGSEGMTENPRVIVVIPTYNEADCLPELFRRLSALPVQNLTLLFVDDGSPDGTAVIARQLAQNYDQRFAVHVLERQGRLGLGTAYVEGFTRALMNSPDFVFQMDADMSHPVEELPQMLSELASADVVVGSRYIQGFTKMGADKDWGLHRRLISFLGNLSIRLVAGLTVRDVTSGFKGFRADVLRSLDMNQFRCKGFGFQAEMAFICQSKEYRIVEHHFIFANRLYGTSKMGLGIIVEAVWRLMTMRIRSMVQPI